MNSKTIKLTVVALITLLMWQQEGAADCLRPLAIHEKEKGGEIQIYSRQNLDMLVFDAIGADAEVTILPYMAQPAKTYKTLQDLAEVLTKGDRETCANYHTADMFALSKTGPAQYQLLVSEVCMDRVQELPADGYTCVAHIASPENILRISNGGLKTLPWRYYFVSPEEAEGWPAVFFQIPNVFLLKTARTNGAEYAVQLDQRYINPEVTKKVFEASGGVEEGLLSKIAIDFAAYADFVMRLPPEWIDRELTTASLESAASALERATYAAV